MIESRWRNWRRGSALLAAVLLIWAGLDTLAATSAAPVAQAQAQQSPGPRAEPSPRPTDDAPDRGGEADRSRLRSEERLFDTQRDRIEQEMAIASQTWRAPAEAISMVGPTLVGLLAVYVLARALSRLLSPRPAVPPEQRVEDDDF